MKSSTVTVVVAVICYFSILVLTTCIVALAALGWLGRDDLCFGAAAIVFVATIACGSCVLDVVDRRKKKARKRAKKLEIMRLYGRSDKLRA